MSKNGNLLINIGPKADGTITEEETKVLLDMGEWLAVNEECLEINLQSEPTTDLPICFKITIG